MVCEIIGTGDADLHGPGIVAPKSVYLIGLDL